MKLLVTFMFVALAYVAAVPIETTVDQLDGVSTFDIKDQKDDKIKIISDDSSDGGHESGYDADIESGYESSYEVESELENEVLESSDDESADFKDAPLIPGVVAEKEIKENMIGKVFGGIKNKVTNTIEAVQSAPRKAVNKVSDTMIDAALDAVNITQRVIDGTYNMISG